MNWFEITILSIGVVGASLMAFASILMYKSGDTMYITRPPKQK